MVTYEITTAVEPPLVEAYEHYMRQVHIPDLLATGCFEGATFTRSSAGRYRIRFEAPSESDLERYLEAHATRLRADFASHFPEGVTASREVWVAIESWSSHR
ncbi:hypothetical protein BH24GEM1_BH24GEM1_13490 [soil metagenome]